VFLEVEPASEKPARIRALVSHLPREVFALLADIIKKMKLVTSSGEQNMTKLPVMAQQLAPILFHRKSDVVLELTTLLLENNETIFQLPLPPVDKKQSAPEWLFQINSDLVRWNFSFVDLYHV